MKPLKRTRSQGRPSELSSWTGNEYSGFTLGSGRGIERVCISGLTKEAFFKNYVGPRRPVLIEGCLSEREGWRASNWTNKYLREKAGDARVKVEFRDKRSERFGQGREKAMAFGDFLDEMGRKNDLLYLTTQELGLDASGRPQLMSAPLDSLKGDFPLRPSLLGMLVPQNVNLWMGYSAQGTSSGLHHDFHDNLYVLLRGKKTFRLFSPADAHRMYVEGELVKVHPNGRINYRGKETLADGSDPLAEAAARAAECLDGAALRAEKVQSEISSGTPLVDHPSGQSVEDLDTDSQRRKVLQASSRSEEEVASAQAALDSGESGAAKRLTAAEDELEKALEAVLDAECAGGGGFGDGDTDESSDSEGGPGFFDGVNDNPTEEDFAAAGRIHVAIRPESVAGLNTVHDGVGGDGGGIEVKATSETTGPSRNGLDKLPGKRVKMAVEEDRKDAQRPANFSRVDLSLSPEELARQFPLFGEAASCTVEVRAGEMLFLPAGWFHEVSSVASDNGHMAFNYWFHPPDAEPRHAGDPSRPYKSTFWQRDWEDRLREEDNNE